MTASPELELYAALTWGLDHPVPADSAALAAFLARSLGPSSSRRYHYGSRAQGRKPRADSAYDFFVIVDDYRCMNRCPPRSARPTRPVWQPRWLMCFRQMSFRSWIAPPGYAPNAA